MARRAARQVTPADDLPVARVAVDVSLAHLDRPFDYLVPQRLAAAAVPGCRVRVRFAGQLTGGYLLARLAASDHPGRLAYLERVVSPEPVLRPEIAALAREVADRYAGTLADVLRLAIPPRHAAAEAAPAGPAGAGPADGGGGGRPPAPAPGPWARYPAGPAFLAALADGRAPRAVWTALPGPDWPAEIALAAAATAASGRGTLIVLPDARDLGRTDQALASVLGPGSHACLAAGLGPAERYRRWLTVSRGQVRVVAGTRAAMFAPVHDLGLVVIWDDGDDLHAEPRAPYPHAREVLALRAHRAGAAALIGGFARTAEATSLVSSGWAAALAAARPQVRASAPKISAAGADTELTRDSEARSARIPGLALRTARAGLARGPVLVQVPRRGYVTAVACENCRASARCAVCGGPLALATGTGPAGGEVIVVAEASLPVVQALIRWDPAAHAERELAERYTLRFPPAVRMAAVSGPERAVAALLAAADLPPDAEVLGPVTQEGAAAPAGNGAGQAPADTVRMLVRMPRSGASALAGALQAAQAVRSARKDAGPVRVQLDPAELI